MRGLSFSILFLILQFVYETHGRAVNSKHSTQTFRRGRPHLERKTENLEKVLPSVQFLGRSKSRFDDAPEYLKVTKYEGHRTGRGRNRVRASRYQRRRKFIEREPENIENVLPSRADGNDNGVSGVMNGRSNGDTGVNGINGAATVNGNGASNGVGIVNGVTTVANGDVGVNGISANGETAVVGNGDVGVRPVNGVNGINGNGETAVVNGDIGVGPINGVNGINGNEVTTAVNGDIGVGPINGINGNGVTTAVNGDIGVGPINGVNGLNGNGVTTALNGDIGVGPINGVNGINGNGVTTAVNGDIGVGPTNGVNGINGNGVTTEGPINGVNGNGETTVGNGGDVVEPTSPDGSDEKPERWTDRSDQGNGREDQIENRIDFLGDTAHLRNGRGWVHPDNANSDSTERKHGIQKIKTNTRKLDLFAFSDDSWSTSSECEDCYESEQKQSDRLSNAGGRKSMLSRFRFLSTRPNVLKPSRKGANKILRHSDEWVQDSSEDCDSSESDCEYYDSRPKNVLSRTKQTISQDSDEKRRRHRTRNDNITSRKQSDSVEWIYDCDSDSDCDLSYESDHSDLPFRNQNKENKNIQKIITSALSGNKRPMTTKDESDWSSEYESIEYDSFENSNHVTYSKNSKEISKTKSDILNENFEYYSYSDSSDWDDGESFFYSDEKK